MPKDFVPNDGVGSYVFVPSRGLFTFVRILTNLIRQRSTYIEKHAIVGSGKKMTIMRDDREPIVANLDGEMILAPGEWTVEVRPASVRFVVPRGVRLS